MPRCTTDEDRRISDRVRVARKAARLSQTQLAEALGVKFQQVQKYESGSDRIAAGQLQRIAHRLGMPIAKFFDEPQDAPAAQPLTVNQAKKALCEASEAYAEAVRLQAA